MPRNARVKLYWLYTWFEFFIFLSSIFSRIYDRWEAEFSRPELIINQSEDGCCVDSIFDYPLDSITLRAL